jgi:transcriptional regulator with XRE-family HTH domain
MITETRFLRGFGRHVAELRKKRRLTQEELAELVGLHRTYIGFIEQGKRNPSIGNVHRIAKALNVSMKALFTPF